jgi:hypothetical protein
MRLVYASALAAALMIPVANAAPQAQEADRKVAGGGITVPGWQGVIDEASAKQGMTIKDSKFDAMGNDLHLTIGPAAIYWNPKNTASGDYTVTATFKDLKPGSAGHPHPAGLFIGGTALDGKKTLLYCTAYSSGEFLVRGFSDGTVFTLTTRPNGRGGSIPNAAVSKPGADGTSVNTVAWQVKGGRAECLINGTSVAGYNKDEIVGAGKLSSLDGIYGIRVSHNMDVMVSGLAKK